MNIILENIKYLAINENVTITKLENIIGASKGVLSRAIANDTDIQTKWILKIVENYPQYSCEWLIKRDGPMLKNPENINPQESNLEIAVNYKELAESRKETIEIQKKVISYLEAQIENSNL